MSLEAQQHIDRQQNRVDSLDGLEDGKVELSGQSYSEIIINEVDTFQSFLAKSELEDDSTDAYETQVVRILQEANISNITDSAFLLHQRLAEIADRINAETGNVVFESSETTPDMEAVNRILEQADDFNEQLLVMGTIDEFIESIDAEIQMMKDSRTKLSKSLEGSEGYGYSIEPRNIGVNLENVGRYALGQPLRATEKEATIKNYDTYIRNLGDIKVGLISFKQILNESVQQGETLSVQEAWSYLSGDNKYADNIEPLFANDPGRLRTLRSYFGALLNSPEGKLMESVIFGDSNNSAMAHYYVNKGVALSQTISPSLGEGYFKAVEEQFDGLGLENIPKGLRLDAKDQAYEFLIEFGNQMFRLDRAALMVVTMGSSTIISGADGAISGTRVGIAAARAASVVRESATAMKFLKIIPGIPVITRSAQATGLVGNILRFGVNFGLDMGKSIGAVSLAKTTGGDGTAYVVGTLCSFMPGSVQGYCLGAQASLKELIEESGQLGIQKLVAYCSKKAGGTKILETTLVEGVMRQAEASGQSLDREMVAGRISSGLALVSQD